MAPLKEPLKIYVKGPADPQKIEKALKAKLKTFKTEEFVSGDEIIIQVDGISNGMQDMQKKQK